MSNPYMTPIPVEERVRQAILRAPNKPPNKIANAIRGATAGMVREIKQTMTGEKLPPPPVRENAGIISVESVKAKFDTVGAIRRELGKLPRGKIIPEAELCQLTSGVDRSRFRRTVENNAEEFRPVRIKLRLDRSIEAKWFWGHAEDIAELERARDL